jgi:hypothetical protein
VSAATTEDSPPKLTWRGFVGLMGFFAALCTIFGLVVTMAEAWQERAEAHWPETTARIEACSVDPTTDGQRRLIVCHLTYAVDAKKIATTVHSRSILWPVFWEYPANQIGQMEEWVDAHPQGATISVHYDPANHQNAALVVTDMPRGGPRTPSNLKLLAVVAFCCITLLSIARLLRPRSTAVA